MPGYPGISPTTHVTGSGSAGMNAASSRIAAVTAPPTKPVMQIAFMSLMSSMGDKPMAPQPSLQGTAA